MLRREACATRRQSQTSRPGHHVLPAVVLAVTLLSACSPGATKSWVAGSTAATESTAPAPGTATESAPAVVAEDPSPAPLPVPIGRSVATDPPQPQTQKTQVVLSYAGWNSTTAAVEAGGYLSPVVETGGTCTLALTKGSRTVTAAAPARADATTTSCGDLAVPRAQLTPGSWTAVLRYASRTTTGTSDPMPVAVPQ